MSTFNRNTLAAALAVSLASLVSAPAMASGSVTGATQTPFAHEVTGKGTGAATDPKAIAQGFGFDVKAPDILIGRTSTSGDITVFVTFSGADVATAPTVSIGSPYWGADTLPGTPDDLATIGSTNFSGNVLQFTVSPPATPGLVVGQLFSIAALSFENALSLQSGGAGINATVRIVDTNTNIELLPNTSGAVLGATYGSETTLDPKTSLTVDVTAPSQKKQFLDVPGFPLGNQKFAKIGKVTVAQADTDSVAAGVQIASTTGSGNTTNVSALPPPVGVASNFQFAAAGADKIKLTLNVPSPAAFTTIPAAGTTPAKWGGFYAIDSGTACADATTTVPAGGTALAQSTTNPNSFSVLNLPIGAITGAAYNICAVANGVSTIANQTISATAQIDLTGALTIDPPAVSGDIADIGFNGTVVNVATFNPAGNSTQESFLRISNSSTIDGLVTVEGTDDAGNPGTGTVTFTLPAGESLQVNSGDIENGNATKGLAGALGDGTGKWRLVVTGEFSDMVVTSLNRNNTVGTLTDISSTSNKNSGSNVQ
ncbi:MAG: hypothetical protein CVV12_13865 [Gammaproteobacteria bacterium HGW-Gammaproteobacteria-2]|jgi:hypothetical protein|nr:MAG: hypothetical protein CVV12_13865 [Gammaproteobacteria bacterium HGW-Gammaproteobacteria-2]